MRKKKDKSTCMCGGSGVYVDFFKAPNGKTVKIKQTCICKAIKEHKEQK